MDNMFWWLLIHVMFLPVCHSPSPFFIFFRHPANIHLLLQVHVVLQVSQTSLVQPRRHLSDVAAQVLEQLRVAVAASQAQLGLPGQVDGVEDVLVPEDGGRGDRSARVSQGQPGSAQVSPGQPRSAASGSRTRCSCTHLLWMLAFSSLSRTP